MVMKLPKIRSWVRVFMLKHRFRLNMMTINMMSLFRTAALNGWHKVCEPGERVETYTKIEQG